MRNSKYLIIILPFLVIVFFFFINQNVKMVKDSGDIENRSKIKSPEFDISHLDKFPSDYEEYYNDNFSLRSYFLQQYNYLSKNIFKKIILSNKFIQGDDDFVFVLDRFQKNTKLYKNEHLELLRRDLEYRDSIFKSFGADMYIFVIPNKSSFYRDKLPLLFSGVNTRRNIEMLDYLNKKSSINLFNIKDFLESKSDTCFLYQKYDTHWNNLGAYWAYYYILSQLSNKYQSVKPLPISSFKITDTIVSKGDIAKNLGLPLSNKQYIFKPLFKKEYWKAKSSVKFDPEKFFNYGFETIKNSNKNLPRAIIIHDSFLGAMKPFLFTTFSEGLFLWDKWKYLPHYEIVEEFKPDIVLYIMSENNFEELFKDPYYKNFYKLNPK